MPFFTVLMVLVSMFFVIQSVLILKYAESEAASRRRAIEQLQLVATQLYQTPTMLPIRYASHKRFTALWKVLPWDGAGLLVVQQGRVVFLTLSPFNKLVVDEVSNDSTSIHWIGQQWLPNVGITWFALTHNSTTIYITSETGTFLVGSQVTTQQIYASMQQRAQPTQ